jgi:hypothetical protein
MPDASAPTPELITADPMRELLAIRDRFASLEQRVWECQCVLDRLDGNFAALAARIDVKGGHLKDLRLASETGSGNGFSMHPFWEKFRALRPGGGEGKFWRWENRRRQTRHIEPCVLSAGVRTARGPSR